MHLDCQKFCILHRQIYLKGKVKVEGSMKSYFLTEKKLRVLEPLTKLLKQSRKYYELHFTCNFSKKKKPRRQNTETFSEWKNFGKILNIL